MTERFKILIRLCIIIVSLSSSILKAQVLSDTASLNMIMKCVACIYNFEFDRAIEISNQVSLKYSRQPVEYMIRGMITYWQNYPLTPSAPAHVSFENDLRNCISLSDEVPNPVDEAEYLLTGLCARGLLLMYYTDNGLSGEAIRLTKETYRNIRRAFDYTEVYPDFYFFTGLYNYHREAYFEVHPLFRALAFLFPKGNKSLGIKELQIAASNAIILKAESLYELIWINGGFENNINHAFGYSKSLHEQYPANLNYLGEYIKYLLLTKEYDKAETLLGHSVLNITNQYYLAQQTIFNGILQEKKYHNYTLAQQYYNKGISELTIFGEFGNEFTAYAYYGLSRISERNSDKPDMRTYRNKANDLAPFKKINFDD